MTRLFETFSIGRSHR